LHLEILDVISEFHEYPKEKIQQGIDGCSAPIFAFPVYNQAVAYKNLIYPSKFSDSIQKACKTMVDAIVNYPEMIAGEKRYCTDLMRQSNGKLIGKTGADGVYSIGIREMNLGICIKVDDGKMGPQYNIAQAVIEQLHVLSNEANSSLRNYVEQENKNFGGLVTGETSVSENVKVVLKGQQA
jgi:L-asparaginase II